MQEKLQDAAEGKIEERDALALEIISLAYAVDRMTRYAVFIDYSGHVERLSIKIVESKDRWESEVASTDFYARRRWRKEDGDIPYLEAKRDHLRHILDFNDVNLNAMEERVERVVSYAF